MKILKIFCIFLSINFIINEPQVLTDDENQLQEDETQIQNLKKERDSYQKNRSFVETWLKFWKNPITEEESYVQDNTNEIKINIPGGTDIIHIDSKPNVDDTLIDKHFTMDKNFEACEELIELHRPLYELERFYFQYNSQKGTPLNRAYPIDYMNKLNQLVYKTVQQIAESERTVFKDVILLKTSAFFIKGAGFKLQSFYYNDSTFADTEKMILDRSEELLEPYYLEYMKQKEILIQNVSEVEGFINNLNDYYQELFQLNQVEDAMMIRDITDEILRKMRKLFELRIDTIDQIAMIKQELKKYAEVKPELDRILGKAAFLVQGLKEKPVDKPTFNIEEQIKENEAKQEQEGSKREIQQKLDNGEIKMSDIQDPDLAQDLLRNPPKTTSNLVKEIKEFTKNIFISSIMIIIF